MGVDLTEEKLTDDAIGFGNSFAEAAKNALKHYENQKRLAEEQKANPAFRQVQAILANKASKLHS